MTLCQWYMITTITHAMVVGGLGDPTAGTTVAGAVSPARVVPTWIGDRLAALPREARRAGARARGRIAATVIPAVDSEAAIVVTVHPIPALCAAARVVQSLAHLQHGLQPPVALGAQQLSDSLLRAVLVDRQQRGSTARGAGAPVCTGVAALAIRIGYPRCELICHARRAACICISHHV